MPEQELLDNPIWNALCTEHAALAVGDEHARRYPQEIGPLSGTPDQTPASYAELRELAGQNPVVLFSIEPFRIPAGWQRLRGGDLVQMIRLASPERRWPDPERRPQYRQLTAADAPAMVALAELTEPGPFRLRTLELGNFYGIFEGDSLMAMSGKRMHLPGLVEVSGVCTHPDARGRGYAAHLMGIVIGEIEGEGKIPFLHAFADNPAVRLYERLGFQQRQRFELAVIRPE
jgi:ribosomal protein S18 acetylase RimI-like enzyme